MEKIKGFYINRRDNAPDFVLANIGIKVDDFINWLKENANEKGYVNIDLLNGNNGPYVKKNDWKPKTETKIDW